jgi:hypothetical protein
MSGTCLEQAEETMATEQTVESAAFDVPLGELVGSLASAVVEAQLNLDRSAMLMAEMMSGQRLLRDLKSGVLIDADGKPSTEPVVLDSRVYFGHQVEGGRTVPVKLSMLELGFTPTFYHFVETVIEVRVALRVSRSENAAGSTVYALKGTTVDATYAGTYNYDLEAACLFKTKLVPIPSPPLLEQRIRLMLEASKTGAGAAQAGGGMAGPGKTAAPAKKAP